LKYAPVLQRRKEEQRTFYFSETKITARATKTACIRERTAKSICRDLENAERIWKKCSKPQKILLARKEMSLNEFERCVLRTEVLECYEVNTGFFTFRQLLL
jgi:hypothetical protein